MVHMVAHPTGCSTLVPCPFSGSQSVEVQEDDVVNDVCMLQHSKDMSTAMPS